MSVSNHLKEIRIEKNIKQDDIAEAVGSCRRSISRIERGERNPSLEMAIRIANYLQLSVEEVFQVEDLQ